MPEQPLVHPVPDEAAAKPPLLSEQIPVLLEAAGAVAHGVGILAGNQGPTLSLEISHVG